MVGVVQAVSLAKSMKHPQKNNSTRLFLHENDKRTFCREPTHQTEGRKLRGQKNAMREQGRDGYGEKKRTCSIAGKSKKMDE